MLVFLQHTLPDTIENISIWEDSNVKVGLNYSVELALLFIAKKRVGHPDSARVGHSQVFDTACNKIKVCI